MIDRSDVMRKIHSSDTKPEKQLRQILWHHGLRYRKNYRVGGTRVDIAFTRAKLAILVDGCFWHGCPLHYRRPKTRQCYWDTKLQRNIARDKRNNNQLKGIGWHVIRIWEHESPENALQIVLSAKDGSK